MVLESLMSVRDSVKNPWHMAIFGAIIAFGSLGIGYTVFPENAGLMSVFLITIISTPLMLRLLRYEEFREERKLSRAKGLAERINPFAAFSRQREIFVVYSAFFAGVVVAMTLYFALLPDDIVNKIFQDQINQIGKVSAMFGNFVAGGPFEKILVNNLAVLAVSFVFALLFGVGAIFILAWNASILATAIGLVAKASGVPTALLTFLPHGVFEMAAYFVAGIAGGILSVAISKRGTKNFLAITEDMFVLMVFSVVLILAGAFVEILQIT